MAEPLPKEPKQLKAFAVFFKNYMNVWAVVVAALPVPLAAFKLIPVYTDQSGILSTFTTLFCFLLLGFIFYSRHSIARWMFRDVLGFGWGLTRTMCILPVVLICLSFVSTGLYYYFLTNSLRQVQVELHQEVNLTDYILKRIPPAHIPNGLQLMLAYLLCFIFAEAAFILMAVREYLQDVLGITDVELVNNQRRAARSQK
jgi:hypothetical protein